MGDEKREPVKVDPSNKDAAIKPDPETMNTTDPQEHMKGPLSSLMHKIEETAEKNDEKDAE
jgi:hypothetical protein